MQWPEFYRRLRGVVNRLKKGAPIRPLVIAHHLWDELTNLARLMEDLAQNCENMNNAELEDRRLIGELRRDIRRLEERINRLER